MTCWKWALAAWLGGSLPVGVLVGRVIRLRDEQGSSDWRGMTVSGLEEFTDGTAHTWFGWLAVTEVEVNAPAVSH